MHAHPDLHSLPVTPAMASKRAGCGDGTDQTLRRIGEHIKESVSLSIYFDSIGFSECLPQKVPVICLGAGVPLRAKPLEQAGGTFDVRQKQGDSAGRKIWAHFAFCG